MNVIQPMEELPEHIQNLRISLYFSPEAVQYYLKIKADSSQFHHS